nr:MAG TPA: MatP C-terminal ribbon-helix-helix domain [Caudoviricetes sp.]
MSKSNKRKLTLSVEDNLVKTLKVKAIQYDLTVSQLVEVLAIVAERDKKLFNELVNKYKKS